MKKQLLGLSVLAAFLSTSALAAGPIANIEVTGDIKPPTCSINSGNNDLIYEYTISPSLLPADGNLRLEPQFLPIEVICNATTYLSLKPIDNRAGTELTQGIYNFGLGSYNGEDNIGFYTITLDNGTVKSTPNSNSVPAGFRKSLTTNVYDSFRLDKTASTSWTTGISDPSLAAGQVFTADVSVGPSINGKLRTVTDEIALDGDATLQFTFGL